MIIGRTARLAVAAASLMLSACGDDAPEPATLAVTDVRVWTGDEARPWAEAVAVSGDRIVGVGSNDDVAGLIGPETNVLTADGGMLVHDGRRESVR